MRILIIADIHGNLVALESVLSAAGSVDEVWCLGDIVGYGPRPAECVERVQVIARDVSVVGNHDWACLGRAALESFNPIAQYALRWTIAQLGREHLAYLEGLPNRMISGTSTVVHGSPRNPVWEYVYNAHLAAVNFSYFDTPVCFFGHTHVPFVIREQEALHGLPPYAPRHGDRIQLAGDRYMINPGAVGQPRDGDARAAYAIYDPDEGAVSFYRTLYPVEEVQEEMRDAGLPEPLVRRLALGL
mgnify:CR=1 FL=1